MTATKCQRCMTWWSHHCGYAKFAYITRLCPNCIAASFPRVGLAPLRPTPTSHRRIR